jgi:hypothetical protein
MSGLKVNESTERVSKYYTGTENFKVIAINPTKEEMKAILNIDVDKEPEYLGKNQEGKDQVRITMWLDNDDAENKIRTRADFYLVNDVKESSGGKIKFVNAFGGFAYLPADGTVPENMSWFNVDKMRKSLVGEEELTEFVKNYINHSTKKGEKAQLSVDAYLRGDFSELKGIICNNKVKVCLGIKQGTDKEGKTVYYQTVYTRKTDRAWAKNSDKIIDDIVQYKANGGATTIFFGEGSYTLTTVLDPSKLEFFGADKPEDLVAAKPAF